LLRQVGEPDVLDVLIIEDIHWADEATLDLLRFMGRRLGDAPVLLIATYRDGAITVGDSNVGGPDVMRGQLDRLPEVVPLPRSSLGIIPTKAPSAVWAGNGRTHRPCPACSPWQTWRRRLAWVGCRPRCRVGWASGELVCLPQRAEPCRSPVIWKEESVDPQVGSGPVDECSGDTLPAGA
jgi:hypothetical protein